MLQLYIDVKITHVRIDANRRTSMIDSAEAGTMLSAVSDKRDAPRRQAPATKLTSIGKVLLEKARWLKHVRILKQLYISVPYSHRDLVDCQSQGIYLSCILATIGQSRQAPQRTSTWVHDTRGLSGPEGALIRTSHNYRATLCRVY
jgi:hypothetical protein